MLTRGAPWERLPADRKRLNTQYNHAALKGRFFLTAALAPAMPFCRRSDIRQMRIKAGDKDNRRLARQRKPQKRIDEFAEAEHFWADAAIRMSVAGRRWSPALARI